ncbi:restriction endonuclease subunit S [Shewanella algae]|uniref:restriction endonuclease subunit S n=1 Tax=Shewanella algae TaxID=38313 RepID=UPI001182952F|nr:restriction endonuclease subunit S [Shewanella algae]
MNIMLAWKRGQGVTKYSGIVSPAYSVYRFFNNANPDFMHYLFRTDLYTGHFKTRSTGVIDSRLRLYPESFFDVSVLLPSIEEQRTIAAFLDYETARIDSLIDKQQRLIELLKEKRQAVISHAVTKGLNPDALLKDSGVEWLGQVPEHWDMPKLKWHCATVSGGTPSTAKHEEYYEGGKFPWVRTTDLNNSELFETPIKITQKAINDTACSLLPKGSVLVAMYGGAGSIGKHARLMFPSTINQAVCGILPNDKLEPSFLHLYVEFYRPYWMVGAEGTRKDPNIGQDHIRDLVLACPPLSEQRAIVEYVDKYRHQHQLLEAKALTAIKLMQERRTALISAAVTGKIDLRGWTAPREG